MSDLKYIREYYGVPAKQGEPFSYKGMNGVVTGANGPHVMARLDGEKHSKPYHPTDLHWPNLKGGAS